MEHIPPVIYKDGSLIRMEGCVQPGIEDCAALRATIKRVEAARDEMRRLAAYARQKSLGNPFSPGFSVISEARDDDADLLDAALRGEGNGVG